MATTIEILTIETTLDEAGQATSKHAEITISDGVDTYASRVGGIPLEGNEQSYLDARADELWLAASTKAETPDLYNLRLRRILKAFVLVVLDEINILRQEAGLAERTAGQIETAIKNKLGG